MLVVAQSCRPRALTPDVVPHRTARVAQKVVNLTATAIAKLVPPSPTFPTLPAYIHHRRGQAHTACPSSRPVISCHPVAAMFHLLVPDEPQCTRYKATCLGKVLRGHGRWQSCRSSAATAVIQIEGRNWGPSDATWTCEAEDHSHSSLLNNHGNGYLYGVDFPTG